ncbi:MAG: toll/interleukin-1 receptor domain-containing protein [Paraclostridium sordellii]
MIQIYCDIDKKYNREIKIQIQNKLREFIKYFLDCVDEATALGESWIYECVFPKYIVKCKKELCVRVVEELAYWIEDEYNHTLTPIHEHALYGILAYCKEIEKEFMEEQGQSLFNINYNLKYNYENDNIEAFKDLINTFEFYQDICFEDHDFLGVANFYELYKQSECVFDQLGVDLDKYTNLMPSDIEDEYRAIKETRASNQHIIDNKRGEDKMSINPKAFISYSWDSEEHKDWVKQLWQTLRENGVDATIDEVETQTETIDLNRMMVEGIKNNDYVIVVLTENYARKSDDFQGGVGLEATFLQNFRLKNPKKIIPIIRSGGSNSIPFYLQGLNYIDFSDDNNISNSFKDLLHRVFEKNKYEVVEIGERPNLESKKVQAFNFNVNDKTNIEGIREELIPDFTKSVEPSDLEKNRFIKESYKEIKTKLDSVLLLTKQNNAGFEYEIDELTQLKCIIRVYLNGCSKHSLKIWVGNGLGGSDLSINMAYGYNISDNDNSMNEIIRCNIDKNKELFLSMTMNFSNKNEYMTANQVFEVIWKNILENIKRS